MVPTINIIKNAQSLTQVLESMSLISKILYDEVMDKELAHWYENYEANSMKSKIKGILECKTVVQACIKYSKDFRDINGIVRIWEERQAETRVKLDIDTYIRYNWHAEMWTKLPAKEWNYRRIKWIYDPDGGKDKTNFCKCFRSHYGGMYFKTVSGSANIANCIKEQLKSGATAKYILIDLPRATKTHKMWDTIECILDGEMTSTKYRGECISMPECRPVIFSNWKPFDDEMMETAKKLKLETEDYISKDRWDFGKIVPFTNHKGQPDYKIEWEENAFYDPKFDDKKPKVGTYTKNGAVMWKPEIAPETTSEPDG